MNEIDAITAIVDQAMAPTKRLAHFPAKVVTQHDDLTVDVQPDSPYLPGLSSLPLRTFIPGATVKVQAGTRVRVVFEDGDASMPVAVPVFDQDAGGMLELAIVCTDIRLGSANPSDAAALASLVKSEIQKVIDGYNGHTHPGVLVGEASTAVPASPLASAGSVESSVVKISG